MGEDLVLALVAGLGLGFTVGAQPGPMSLFLVRSTLRGSLQTGIAIGAGIALIDVLYAGVAAAGLAPVLRVGVVRVIIGVLGSALLLALGLRTFWSAFRVRVGGELEEEVRTPRRAFVTSLGATASNPLTIALWTGGFAAAGAAAQVHSGYAAAALLAGIGLGSLAWFTILSSAVTLARRWLRSPALRGVDGCAGLGLAAFGGLLGYRALHDA
jgi:putative LysE/RhtB family amino acid efflux pump